MKAMFEIYDKKLGDISFLFLHSAYIFVCCGDLATKFVKPCDVKREMYGLDG